MNVIDLAVGLRAGAIAGAVSGAPSTVHALATRRPVLDAVRAAGTLVLPDDSPPVALTLAGVAAHTGISLGWGVVMMGVLPRRRAVLWGAFAGLMIAALDLGVLGRRWRRIRGLPVLPQVVDHVAYGAVVGAVVSRSAPARRARHA
jgi:hypothetical protein